MAFLATLALVSALEMSVDDLDPMLNSQFAIVQRNKGSEAKKSSSASPESKAISAEGQQPPATVEVQKGTTILIEPAQIKGSVQSALGSAQELPESSFRMTFPNSFNFSASSLKSIKGLDKKISIKATNVTAAKISELLTKHGVNFVIRDKDVSAEKLTINLNNVPLHEALEVIGETLGGYWEAKGSTLVFKKGAMFSFAPAMEGLGQFKDMKLLEGLPMMPPAEFPKDFAKIREESSRMREQGARMREQAAKMREQSAKVREEASQARAEAAAKRKEQIEKFRSSLTPEQKNLMKKRGYLIGKDDLTKEQRELLNIQEMINSGCDYEVNINNEIVVRNK